MRVIMTRRKRVRRSKRRSKKKMITMMSMELITMTRKTLEKRRTRGVTKNLMSLVKSRVKLSRKTQIKTIKTIKRKLLSLNPRISKNLLKLNQRLKKKKHLLKNLKKKLSNQKRRK